MAHDSFQFKQFSVRQDQCAMKVGTDSVLLGAWASVSSGCTKILDIGTGTGLIALMMAQRCKKAHVWAIDIDEPATLQASENVKQSPFAERITVEKADICQWNAVDNFDVIVCNPPYFQNALRTPDAQRATARHTVSLNFRLLIDAVSLLLSNHGQCSLILPYEGMQEMKAQIVLHNLFITRIYRISTIAGRAPKRVLLEIRRKPTDSSDFTDQAIYQSVGQYSDWYLNLTSDFYLHL